ncbi:MAG: addiction module protein [Bacteroidota bacterium]
MDVAILKQQALNLTRIERLEFARLLLDSVAEEEEADQLTNPQIEELKNRLKAFREGRMKTISGKDLHQKLTQKYGFSS